MKRSMIASICAILALAPCAWGQHLLDGNFDALAAGSPPNCAQAAGSWLWPAPYINTNLCEDLPAQFQIVPTSSFDSGGTGNSLEMHVVNVLPGKMIQLPNVFAQPITETPAERVIVQFDVLVPDPGVKGGFIMIGGDQGGSGFGAGDRGPQLTWLATGSLTRSTDQLPAGAFVILQGYPIGQWQTVRLVIDLVSDRYDIWWAPRGSPLTLLDAHAPFHEGNQLDHLDRFTLSYLGNGDAHMYMDNVSVATEPVPGGPIIADGGLDGLAPGMPPNCDQYAGAWGWPNVYRVPLTWGLSLCEAALQQFQIVPTSSFDTLATGNSLHLNVTNAPAGQTAYHLPNVWTQVIQETHGQNTEVTFKTWVPQAGVKGGHIYIGANLPGSSSRGPQLGWQADGTITRGPVAGEGSNPIVIVPSYPIGQWQTMRLVIDLVHDNYDVWWAAGRNPLVQVASNVPFRGCNHLDILDRFTVVHFSDTGGLTSQMYVDDLAVEVIPDVAGDVNDDGSVNVSDLLGVINGWGACSAPTPPCSMNCSADVAPHPIGDGTVNVIDLLQVINNWG